MSSLADKIKQYRSQNNLTQDQLAARLFVSRQAVSKWEQGRGYPSTAILEELSKLLDMTIDELIRSEKDEGAAIEFAATYGRRLKNHLVKKLLLFIVPAILSFMYMWVFTGVVTNNASLRDFSSLQEYQAHLEVMDNYIQAAYFVMKLLFLPLSLNIILYLLAASGIIKLKTFKIVIIAFNIMIFAIITLPPVMVCFLNDLIWLTVALMLGCILMLLMFTFAVLFFVLEASKAQREGAEALKIQKDSLKKALLLLLPLVFYVFYISIYLSVLFFSSDKSYRHNYLSSFGSISLWVGLLIFIPLLITACMYLVLILKKMRFSSFLIVSLPLNLIPMLFAGFFAFMVMAMMITGEGIVAGLFLCVGLILTYLIYAVVMIVSLVKAYKIPPKTP